MAHRPAVGLLHAFLQRPPPYKNDGDELTFTEMCDVLTNEMNFDEGRGSNLVHIRSDHILPTGELLLVQVWPNWLDEKGLKALNEAMNEAPSWEEVRNKYQGSTQGTAEEPPSDTATRSQATETSPTGDGSMAPGTETNAVNDGPD